jgi:thioredoxin reductase
LEVDGVGGGAFVGAPVPGQIPDKFTNLKVLPKDISKQELQSTMRGFAFALGVRCEHCHVEEKAPEKGLRTIKTRRRRRA